jgi:hypothetical protein
MPPPDVHTGGDALVVVESATLQEFLSFHVSAGLIWIRSRRTVRVSGIISVKAMPRGFVAPETGKPRVDSLAFSIWRCLAKCHAIAVTRQSPFVL